MARPKSAQRRPLPGDPSDAHGLSAWLLRYLEALQVRHLSPRTLTVRRETLQLFLSWCYERGLTRPTDLTRPMLQRYQRHLFHYRRENGKPLSVNTQHGRLVAIRAFFKWLTRENVLLSNPASELELPRLVKRLPKHVLTAAEAEAILALPDLEDPFGLRDRALLELLYSTGIRRMELAKLEVFDLDVTRGTLRVREGKGGHDRVVPVGERALAWCERYFWEVRPTLALEPDPGVYFLTREGGAFTPGALSLLVRRYIERADLGKTGSCHLWRHSCASLMLENGADIRFLQEMLGHAQLTSTQVYTRVSITQLQQIHAATHPAARLHRKVPQEAEAGSELEEGAEGAGDG